MSDATSRQKKKKVLSPEAIERKRARNREYMRRRNAQLKAAGLPTTKPEVRKRQQEAAKRKYREDESYRELVKARSRKSSLERYRKNKLPWKVMRQKRLARMQSDPEYRRRILDQCKASASRRYAESQEVRNRRAIAWKKWYAKNKSQRSEYRRRYKTKRLKEDHAFWLQHAIRSRLNIALRLKFASGSAVRDLGCTIEQFAKHIESKFLPGMNWGNRGVAGWHIDHIIPLAAFDLRDPEQRKKACHYTNMQPLWAKDNMKKRDKVPKS